MLCLYIFDNNDIQWLLYLPIEIYNNKCIIKLSNEATEENIKMEERRLKDYKGNQVWKCKDQKGDIFYMYNTQDGDCINVYKSLKDLRKDN